MAERTIVGVDFSGGKGAVPWITTAVLEGKHLKVQSCESIAREDLKKRLRKLPGRAVAGMDFPFGLPHEFALELDSGASKMHHLWQVAAAVEYKQFENFRDNFVKKRGEIARCGDRNLSGPLSPLKTGGPNMLPMTFHGMEMLYYLWNCKEPRFRVPPLSEEERDGPLLLETMPGILLRTFHLPHQKYKGSKSDPDSRINRKAILKGLIDCSHLCLEIPPDLDKRCVDYHDCLDSLVAAVAAALSTDDKVLFRCPSPNELDDARLEGWIYAPKPKQ